MKVSTAGGVALCCRKCGSQTPDRWLNESRNTQECRNELAGVIIDRFGHDVWLIPQGEDHFKTRVLVSVSPQFFGWVTGIGSGMKITGPENVKQQYKEYMLDVLQNY